MDSYFDPVSHGEYKTWGPLCFLSGEIVSTHLCTLLHIFKVNLHFDPGLQNHKQQWERFFPQAEVCLKNVVSRCTVASLSRAGNAERAKLKLYSKNLLQKSLSNAFNQALKWRAVVEWKLAYHPTRNKCLHPLKVCVFIFDSCNVVCVTRCRLWCSGKLVQHKLWLCKPLQALSSDNLRVALVCVHTLRPVYREITETEGCVNQTMSHNSMENMNMVL